MFGQARNSSSHSYSFHAACVKRLFATKQHIHTLAACTGTEQHRMQEAGVLGGGGLGHNGGHTTTGTHGKGCTSTVDCCAGLPCCQLSVPFCPVAVHASLRPA